MNNIISGEKAELLQKRGASKEEIKAVLNEAILLTKPFFRKEKNYF